MERITISKSINKVKVQIPGTTYYLQLAEDRGRWILSLLLRNDVEKEIVVPVFSKNGLNKAANEILTDTRLVIDKFALHNVCEKLYNSAETNLPTSQAEQQIEEEVEPSKFDKIENKIEELESSINSITDEYSTSIEEFKENINDFKSSIKELEIERIARLENEFEKSQDTSTEERLNDLSKRVNDLEETVIQSNRDELVDGLVSSLEAVEAKLKQIEGSMLVKSDIDNQGDETDLSILTQSLDSIKNKLSQFENKLSSLEQELLKIKQYESSKSSSGPIER
jgi:chromosome segregation ATPase